MPGPLRLTRGTRARRRPFEWAALVGRVTEDGRALLLALSLVLVDVAVGVANALNLLRVLVGNLDAELLLETHDEFDGVERVGPEVVDETRVGRNLVLVNPKLVDDDLLNFCLNL